MQKPKNSKFFWTAKEDKVLLKYVKQLGIFHGSVLASQEIERARTSCIARYYRIMKEKYPGVNYKKVINTYNKKEELHPVKVNKSGQIIIRNNDLETKITAKRNIKTGAITITID